MTSTEKDYQVLIEHLGQAIHFIQYFHSGKGDYTMELHQWLGNKSLDEVFQEMALYKDSDLNQYKQVIE
jgi:hypothetical protein